MACTALQNYTGASLLQLTKGKPIGIFAASDIDNDISALVEASEMAIAVTDFTAWTGSTQCDFDFTMDETDERCKALAVALKWYAVWRYARASEAISPCKGEDCQGVTKLLSHAKDEACAWANIANTCLPAKIIAKMEEDCSQSTSTIIPDDFFGVSLIETGCESPDVYPTT